MESEFSYSSNTNSLSPVVDPPPEFDLPFEILFNVNSLVQNACLPPTSLDTEFYQFLDPKTHDRAFIDYALPKLLCLGKCSYEHVAWLTKESLEWGKKEKPMKSTLDYQRELFNIRRVKITPTRVYFSGLKPHESNRVFRVYQQFRHKEQLAVLQESWVNGPALEIRITNKINQDAVSWSKLLRSISIFNVDGLAGSFFIDEESCCACRSRQWWTRTEIRYNQRANILGHDKIFQVCEYGRGLNHRKHNKFGFVLPVF
ncbi:unnamed protein product [Brassica oleracea]